MKEDLTDKLETWDGVHSEYLTDLYSENYSDPAFFPDLVEICMSCQDLQKPATWLVKHHYDNGKRLPESLTENLLLVCNNIVNWEAKLHLLQLLPHFCLTKITIAPLENFVRNCIADNNKFVRAWAYNGLYELTKYIPELRAELELMCQSSLETESPAIKSRLKRILLNLNRKK